MSVSLLLYRSGQASGRLSQNRENIVARTVETGVVEDQCVGLSPNKAMKIQRPVELSVALWAPWLVVVFSTEFVTGASDQCPAGFRAGEFLFACSSGVPVKSH